ncbi:protoporphyrinogen oxidase HemJ [Salinarimonas sp. NSM]|uniref:protoporphyrinogen oxidase HemJ n=1 Tax=Salinarimonas sp. NSM TaxID=3458003 RepID=UPI0040362113
MLDGYLWLKSLHVIAIIAWMAGLLYLPRLFVYHTGAKPGTEQSETFKVMERRLLKAITTPAMLVAVVTGLWLAFLGGWWSEGWLHGKLLLVLGLLVSHHLMGRYVKAFAADANDKSSKFFRVFNEAPTLLMIGIVILVIVKPIL